MWSRPTVWQARMVKAWSNVWLSLPPSIAALLTFCNPVVCQNKSKPGWLFLVWLNDWCSFMSPSGSPTLALCRILAQTRVNREPYHGSRDVDLDGYTRRFQSESVNVAIVDHSIRSNEHARLVITTRHRAQLTGTNIKIPKINS